ncbi:hypothetical protein LV779_06175 [Streptomyces thinghirensis]|nr:hypothetical protein [Streptomyces thinghirensis]
MRKLTERLETGPVRVLGDRDRQLERARGRPRTAGPRGQPGAVGGGGR